tara:strand:- start:200 stop:898 length:699 start_codon:yes stop_codon:yes gene_type:complete
MINKTNKEIVSFLDVMSTTNEYYATESDKLYLRKYNACDDFSLPRSLINKTWDELKKHFSALNMITLEVNPVSILHTNAGTGKVLADCPSDNTMVTAFNNDYICKTISDFVNQKGRMNNSYKSEISDISHFFINGDNGNTRKYDIVFTQPSDIRYYKGIDGTILSSKMPLEYYSMRSLAFLTKGGYLCVFTHPKRFKTLTENPSFKNKANLVAQISNRNKFDEYGCLIFKSK